VILEIVLIVLRTLGAIAAAAVLALGFVFIIFLGDANARGQRVVSKGFDRLAALVVYLSWFGLLWRFGFSPLLVMVGCGAALVLCAIYAASYQTTQSRLRQPGSAAT
jgi:hypothetical protein